ncbi:MAG: hypothetical protein ACP5N3_00620 [Candidatus Nanoarchaeia archaeon]
MTKLSAEEIIEIQPFVSKIGRINSAESLLGPSAVSGTSFFITAKNKKYKLRCCEHELAAKKLEKNVSLLSKYFPKFMGREGRFMLFKWIDGKELLEPSIKDCYLIGKMMGEAHALELEDKEKTPDAFFYNRVEKLKGVFSEHLIRRIVKKYEKFKEKLKIKVVLDFNDVHQKNFIKEKETGKIYFVDEEGLDYKIKGLGLAKPFLTSKWLKTKEEREAFWKGYKEHHSNDFFDKDYQEFILFMQLIRSISTKIKTGRDYSKEQAKLLEII